MDQPEVVDASPPITQMLTLRKVAAVLGLTPTTARDFVRSGEIAGFQVGARGMWRVDPVDLQAYIDREKARAEQRHRQRD